MSTSAAPQFSSPEWLDYLNRMLPAYEFQAFIAQGGMGAVFKARQRSLDRDVAVKILSMHLRGDESFRQSFETEARAMARLNHPNLIGVFASGEVDDMPYIVMEYVHGKSLYHSAYGKRVDEQEAVRIIRAICMGLAHAHENGVIHRDIKPSNILLTPKAEPKIGDFGLAVPHDGIAAGPAMGTPGYTAPEIITHPELADRRSDLFAVGAILYELVSGHRPDGKRPLTDDLKDCPASLLPICRRALHPNPQLRYPDATAMAAALDEWQRQQTIVPARAIPGKPAPPPAMAPLAASGAPTPGGSPAKRPERSLGPVAPSSVPAKSGLHDNWYLVIRILLIAGMLGSIPYTYHALIHYREQRAQREADEQDRQEKESSQKTKHSQPKSRPTTSGSKAVLPPASESSTESSLLALARLQAPLQAGERDEYPAGTLQHGDSHFFFINQPMTWLEAAGFAESYGGHLPIPTSNNDIIWLTAQLGNTNSTWLGLGKNPAGQWLLVNGEPLNKNSTPSGTGTFATLGQIGTPSSSDSHQRLPFFIQWHDDGSNPAAFADVCLRLLHSSAAPIWPPGTVSHHSSHYYFVLRKARWDIAQAYARKLGGHLATASDPDEAAWLKSCVYTTGIQEPLWTSGRATKDKHWSWTNFEEWKPSGWFIEDGTQVSGSFLLLDPVRGWVSGPPDSPPHEFVVEWDDAPTGGNPTSHAAGKTPPTETTKTPAGNIPSGTAKSSDPLPEEALTLEPRAKQLIAAAAKDRDNALTANATQFGWDIDVWTRGLSKSELAEWQPEASALKALVRGKYVPDALPESSGIRLSPQMAKVAASCANKQREIETTYLAKARKIQEAYLAKLHTMADAESSLGHETNEQRLHDMESSAAEVYTWLGSLGYPARPAQQNSPPKQTPGGTE